MDKLFGYAPEQWMMALLDVLDGNSYWHDIQYATGLSEERCKEIEKMFNDATKDGWPRRDGKEKFDPRDVSILGGDPSL